MTTQPQVIIPAKKPSTVNGQRVIVLSVEEIEQLARSIGMDYPAIAIG